MPNNSHPVLDALDFSVRLKEAMQESDIPIGRGAGKWLANKYGRSGVTASAWLKGEHRADAECTQQMAKDFGVEFEWLYFGKLPKRRIDGVTEDAAACDAITLSPAERQILQLYRRSTSEFQELAKQLLFAAPKNR